MPAASPSTEVQQALDTDMAYIFCSPPSCATAALVTPSPNLFLHCSLPEFLKHLKEASTAETQSDWVPRDLQVGSWPHHVPALVTATTHSSEFWDRHLLLVLALDCKWEHLRWDESLARLGHRHTVPRASWQGRPIPSLSRLIPDQLPAKPHDPPRTGSQATCTAGPALAAVWGHCDTSPSRPRPPQRALLRELQDGPTPTALGLLPPLPTRCRAVTLHTGYNNLPARSNTDT